MHQENFLASLNDILEKIGPPLKSEESWSSSHYFNYGKVSNIEESSSDDGIEEDPWMWAFQ